MSMKESIDKGEFCEGNKFEYDDGRRESNKTERRD